MATSNELKQTDVEKGQAACMEAVQVTIAHLQGEIRLSVLQEIADALDLDIEPLKAEISSGHITITN